MPQEAYLNFIKIINEMHPNNQRSLNTLTRIFTQFTQDLSLVFVHCNYTNIREKIIHQVKQDCPNFILNVILDANTTHLYQALVKAIETQDRKPQGLMVLGLESVKQLDFLLDLANRMREEFRHQFKFPLILWVTDEVARSLIRVAPDFQSWGTTISFQSSTEDLLEFIQQTADEVSTKVLDSGAGIFLNNSFFNLELGSPLRLELEAAQKELKNHGETLSLELEASLEFVLGRVSDHLGEEALHHYQRSLQLWQQTNNAVRYGQLLFYVGFWWHSSAILNPTERETAYHQAKTYYAQCIQVFKQANHLDLVANFINALADVLLVLKQWEELETVAQASLRYNQIYPHPFREARAYHFLAEVALARFDWKEGKNLAQKAQTLLLKTLDGYRPKTDDEQLILDWESCYHQGWYLLALARAEQQLNQPQDAIKTLEKARIRIKPQYAPELYIQILKNLQLLYFQQSQYLMAYEIKQKRREIEQQFHLRAFIGAGRLGHLQLITNPGLPPLSHSDVINPEIAASGRLSVVNGLTQRMSRPDFKLTVIYGQSGVGKSSILQAGLVPELQKSSIETRRVIPVLQQVYTNWLSDLARALAKGMREVQKFDLDSSAELNSQEEIVRQIKAVVNQNFIVVIIFDQFEEFFFNCRDYQQRQNCYQLIKECLDIPYVKVILSLREDYLHYLLECTRKGYLEIVGNNILDKNIMTYIGNFTPPEAKSVIQSLTERTQFSLESELIDELVIDLAGESGEIRPIELQVVGSQLQAQNIRTLEQYQQSGQKQKLVEDYLDEVIRDCGATNEPLAKLVLYLLTDENNTRPLKTRHDLIRQIKEFANHLEEIIDNLDTVLKIFVLSGLVCLLPEIPTERYQLVHDYLVTLIRQNRSLGIIEDLDIERKKRQQAEARNKKLLQLQITGITLAFFSTIALGFVWINSLKNQKLDLSSALANTQYTALTVLANNKLDGLLVLTQAAQNLKNKKQEDLSVIQQENIKKLSIASQWLQEQKRLDGHHKNSVLSVSLSPDSNLIASASSDGTIKLWNQNGVCLRSLEQHSDWVWSVAFSPKGKYIASASKDKTVKLWKIDGTFLKTFTGHSDEVKWVSFSPDGQQIASASRDKTIKIWDVHGNLITTLTGHLTPILSVNFSPNGQWLVSSSEDGIIYIWNRQGKLIKRFQGHNKAIWSVTFSPDSQKIASASDDSTVKIWNLEGKLLTNLTGHKQAVNSVNFSRDNRFIVTGSSDETIKIWNLDGTLISTIQGHQDLVNQVIFYPDNQTLASASKDGTVRIWNLNSLPQIIHLKYHKIFSLSFNPTNTQLVASPGLDLRTNSNVLVLWNLNGEVLQTFLGHLDTVNNVSFSPDGQTLASSSDDQTVKLWRLDGQEIKTLRHEAAVWSVLFSPNGEWIATASNDNKIKIWTKNGILKHSFLAHDAQINDLSFSPDSRMVASASNDKKIKIWNVENGRLITTLTKENSQFGSVSFSPNGQRLAATLQKKFVQIWQWDNDTWKPVESSNILAKQIKSIRDYEVNFSPNSEILASAGLEGTVKIWTENGVLITTLKQGQDNILSVNFTLDGKRLIAIPQTQSKVPSRVIISPLDSNQVHEPIEVLLNQACQKLKYYYFNDDPSLHNNNQKFCQSN